MPRAPIYWRVHVFPPAAFSLSLGSSGRCSSRFAAAEPCCATVPCGSACRSLVGPSIVAPVMTLELQGDLAPRSDGAWRASAPSPIRTLVPLVPLVPDAHLRRRSPFPAIPQSPLNGAEGESPSAHGDCSRTRLPRYCSRSPLPSASTASRTGWPARRRKASSPRSTCSRYYAIFFTGGWLLYGSARPAPGDRGAPAAYIGIAAATFVPALALYLLQSEPAGASRWTRPAGAVAALGGHLVARFRLARGLPPLPYTRPHPEAALLGGRLLLDLPQPSYR